MTAVPSFCNRVPRSPLRKTSRRRQARVNADLVAAAERQRGLAECALDALRAAHAALAERDDQLAGAPLRG